MVATHSTRFFDAAEYVVELELTNMELPERLWDKIGEFKNLLKLKIDGTNIQDQHLQKLLELPLQSLNIAKTEVTSSGVSSLFAAFVFRAFVRMEYKGEP